MILFVLEFFSDYTRGTYMNLKFFKQKCLFIFLAVLSIGFGLILLNIQSSFLWYWIFGLAFGYILERSHVCFVSATSDPIIYGSTDQFRALLIGILVASLGTSVVKLLANGTYDLLGVSAISLPLILGAFLFGVGMMLAGCCSSGMFIRLGEGNAIHLITFVFMLIGYWIARTHYNVIWLPYVQKSPVVFLPDYLGWKTGIIIHIVLILFFYILALQKEKKESSSADTCYLKGTICLALISVLHLIILKSPWSVSGAFYWIGEFFKNLFYDGLSVNTLDNFTTGFGSNIRNLGLFVGSMISVSLSNGFHIKKISSLKQIIKTSIGGILMGYGACIASGCNISSFFIAASSLSLSAWFFMIALFAGVFVGLKILYKFM